VLTVLYSHYNITQQSLYATDENPSQTHLWYGVLERWKGLACWRGWCSFSPQIVKLVSRISDTPPSTININTVVSPYQWVIHSETYGSYVKLQIILNAIYKVKFNWKIRGSELKHCNNTATNANKGNARSRMEAGSVGSAGSKEDESNTRSAWAARFHHIMVRSCLAGVLKLTNCLILWFSNIFGGCSELQIQDQWIWGHACLIQFTECSIKCCCF
jgi:hypothetical protein